MTSEGMFGYIIGKKKRLMHVKKHSDFLWPILVREIYVLMNHFKTINALQEAFASVKTTKANVKPKEQEKGKYKVFTDLEEAEKTPDDWSTVLRYCQGSYINILDAGYIVNTSQEVGNIFILDFNKGITRFYSKDLNGKITELNAATIEEIMNFNDMPTKCYTEIVANMHQQFADFYEKYIKVQKEIDKLTSIIAQAKMQCSYNIVEKAQTLLDDMLWERTKLIKARRVFYYRFKELNLIEEDT